MRSTLGFGAACGPSREKRAKHAGVWGRLRPHREKRRAKRGALLRGFVVRGFFLRGGLAGGGVLLPFAGAYRDGGALGDAVLGLAVELANGALPMIHERCRDRGLPDDVRRQWTALRSDFEQLGDHPLRLAERRFADRQRALLTPDLMLDEIPEPLLSDLIEPY